jgi:formylglycine-generating enzyme required for sulfatase activity
MIAFLALVASLAASNGPAGAIAPGGSPRHPVRRTTTVRIPSGSYRPLYAAAGVNAVHIDAFTLDRDQVTRADFLEFVRANPQWRRSAVGTALADRGYLSNWVSDLDPGDVAERRRPVTAVSRHAAAAYCAAHGKRLPTVDEWEYAASASDRQADGTRDPVFQRRLLALYARRPNADALAPSGDTAPNYFGIRALHGGVWEWTQDETSATHAAHEHHEHMPSCASAAMGATDPANYPAFLRFAFRSALTSRSTVLSLGFRCAGA